MLRGVIRLADQNPVVFAAWIMGAAAITLPFVVVPIRESLGLKTNQYSKVSRKPVSYD